MVALMPSLLGAILRDGISKRRLVQLLHLGPSKVMMVLQRREILVMLLPLHELVHR